MSETTCPHCGSDCNERDELIKAEREIERINALVSKIKIEHDTYKAAWKSLVGLSSVRQDVLAICEEYKNVLTGEYSADENDKDMQLIAKVVEAIK